MHFEADDRMSLGEKFNSASNAWLWFAPGRHASLYLIQRLRFLSRHWEPHDCVQTKLMSTRRKKPSS